MNRRDTLKSIIAGLFCGLLPKKSTAKPFNYDECEPDYRKWVEDFHTTKWITYIPKADIKYQLIGVFGIEDMWVKDETGKVVGTDRTKVVPIIYLGKSEADARQLLGVDKFNDREYVKLGYTQSEIESGKVNSDEVKYWARVLQNQFNWHPF